MDKKKEGVPKDSLPQLYRFCFLMLGDAAKAQAVFQASMHEAALRSAQGELPKDPLWLFRDARERCLEITEADLQAEEVEWEEHDVSVLAPAQIRSLEPLQLAVWVSGAPEPQRTALALFYLDHFSHEDLLDLTDLKPAELSRHIHNGRQQFQAWLNARCPPEHQHDIHPPA